jgi:hypothetical protein
MGCGPGPGNPPGSAASLADSRAAGYPQSFLEPYAFASRRSRGATRCVEDWTHVGFTCGALS